METKFYYDNVVVKRSNIHGNGVFTEINIPKNSRVMLIRGDIISGDECERREEYGNVYIFWNGETYIDTTNTKKIKYINHNCNYNCEVVDGDEESLILISSRDIYAGEELTIDYGYEEIYDNCQCEKCS